MTNTPIKEEASMKPLDASKLLSDEYSVKILAATFREAKSAQEMSARFDIPIAACYRRIKELEGAGFLKCTARILNQKGKRVKLYRSQVRGAYFFYDRGRLRARLELSRPDKPEIDETWDALEG